MSRIDLNIVATGQFGQVEAALARLRAQVAALSTQMRGMGGIDPSAIRSIQSYVSSFNDAIDRSGMFERHMVNMTTETERFGKSLQQNRLRLSEYSRAIREYRRNEMGQIKQLAREQVRMMNATTMMMPDGRAQVIVPRGIDEAIDKQKILNQEYRIFRQSVQGASTQLINWGKNTQWAGRQLTVGLTVPLTIFGATAAKMFMDVDKELTRLGKVYGGTAGKIASPTQVAEIRTQTQALAKELAASMGIAAQETAGLAADIAATGAEGADLIAATRESVRLSVLGEVDRQEAMRATLAIQSVFKKSNEELADSINFLNSVENQTSTTLNDLVTGIVKAGPVVEGLGGSIEDLALMMVAMREGGVPAAEAANAIKSSMGSLINPTKQTSEQFKEMGINLRGIVDKNAGDLIGTLTNLQKELSKLDDLSRQRAIEQLFGKYQFARINALLSNLGRAGSQTEEVTKLAALSATQLAKTAENELKILTESASMRFKRALETIKANMIPIGETFVNVGTVLLEIGNRIFEIFNSLPEPVKNFIKGLGLLVGIAGPIIMITGVLGNFVGYIVKGVGAFMGLKKAGRGVFEFFTPESVAAKTASELLTGAVYNQTEAFGVMNAALETLNQNLKEMTNNLNAAGGASGNMATQAVAAAEAAAVASTGGIPIRSGSKGTFKGSEVSHLIPESQLIKMLGDERTAKMLMSPGSFLANVDDIMGREFQQLAGTRFAPGFYDTSQGSRTEILSGIAGDDPDLKNLIANMSETTQQRLLPTLEEHSAYVGKYQILMEQLFTKDKDAINKATGAMRRHLNTGNVDGAIAELMSATGMNEQALTAQVNSYVATQRQLYDSLIKSGMSAKEASEQVILRMAQQEAALQQQAMTKGVQYLGKGTSAENAKRMLFYMLAGVSANIETSVKEMTDLVGQNNREVLRNARVNGQRLAQFTDTNKNRFLMDLNTGLMYAVDQQTGEITRKLSASEAKKKAATANARAAILRLENAEQRLQLMTQLELQEAALALEGAAGTLGPGGVPGAPGAKTPGRFSRFMSGTGGMGIIGGLSALSMLGGAVQNNESGPTAAGNAMSILGATGMGASLGMMVGPQGAIAGAAIGALAGTVMAARSNMDAVRDNAKKLADSMSLSAETLNSTAEFFGGTLLTDRASAASVLEGTGIRQKQLTRGQEYLESESGKSFVEGFSQAISSYGFNNALEGMANNLSTMIMQGAISFEDAEGIAAAMAEELNMPQLTAEVQGQLVSMVGPDGRDILNKPISIALELQEESMRQSAQMQAAILTEELGNIDPTAMQNVATWAAGGPIVGSLIDSLGNMDIPGVSGWVRDLRGFVNEDYAAAVGGVSALGKTIGNQLRTAYDNVNAAKQRYIELEDQVAKMEGGPEKKKAIANLEKEKRKIDELEVSYEQMRSQSSEYFGDLLAKDAGLAAEYLGSMSTSIKEMFAGTVEDPAAQALLGMLSGMDQQIQADIMLNISSGQLSPTAAVSFMNMLGGGENAALGLDLVVKSQGIEGANQTLLTLMQIEDEEIRKTLTLKLLVESGGKDEALLLTDQEEKDLENRLGRLKTQRDALLSQRENGTLLSFFDSDMYDDDIADVEKDIADIEAQLDAAEARSEAVANASRGYTDVNSARYAAQVPGGDMSGVMEASTATAAEYTLALQELGKLDIEPQIDLSQVQGVNQQTLEGVTGILQEILALPDEIVKSIDINSVQAMGDLKRFEVNWKKIDSFEELEKSIGAADNFSDTFKKFGINYQAFNALPDIVKYMIMYYVELMIKIQAQIDAIGNAAGIEEQRGKLGLQNQLSSIMDTVQGMIGSSQDAGYTPGTTGGGPPPAGGGDSGGGSGGKDKNPYEDLIKDQNKLIDAIRKEREERERILRLQEESLNFMLKQQGLQNQIARARAEGNFAEAALLQAQKDIEVQQRDREKEEERRQLAEDKEIQKREQMIEILEKGGAFAEKLAAAIKKLDGAIPYALLNRGKGKGKGKAFGGMVSGPGGPRDDLIPVMLSNGEFVVQASAVNKYGVGFMQMINSKQLDGFASGGYSSRYPSMASKMASGGLVLRGSDGPLAANNNTEYNIEVNVSGTNASADDIATEVIRAIERRKRMNGTMIRV